MNATFSRLLALAAFCAVTLTAPYQAQAQSPSLVAGRDFLAVTPAQPTEAQGKLEVLEFFSYACPHCHDFDAPLNAWAKAAPPDVALRRVPITFGRDQWVPLARLYYTLEALGELGRLHAKVFEAIHKDNVTLTQENTQFDWAAKQGIDRKKYVEVYQSFAVQSKVSRANQQAAAYKIQGVPALAVDGKYLLTGSLAGTHAKMLSLTDQVLARARSERKK